MGTKIENVIRHSRIRYSLILAISNKRVICRQIIKGSVNGEFFLKFIKILVKKLQKIDNNYVLLAMAVT